MDAVSAGSGWSGAAPWKPVSDLARLVKSLVFSAQDYAFPLKAYLDKMGFTP